jgi:YidC/Oxa1 family membrane protein insertase
VDGRPNALLSADLFGVPLGAAGPHAGWPLLVLLVAIALVATVSARRIRRGGGPAWLAALPFLTLVPAITMPLAAGLYLLTTTTWTATETAILRRE